MVGDAEAPPPIRKPHLLVRPGVSDKWCDPSSRFDAEIGLVKGPGVLPPDARSLFEDQKSTLRPALTEAPCQEPVGKTASDENEIHAHAVADDAFWAATGSQQVTLSMGSEVIGSAPIRRALVMASRAVAQENRTWLP